MTKIDGGLRPLFRERLPEFMWTSIETGGTGRGIPDSHYLAPGRPLGIDGWIEFKVCDHWIIKSYKPEQAGWLYRRARMGGRTWIAVRQYQGGQDILWLVHGIFARELKSGGLRHEVIEASSAKWTGGPSRWAWGQVAQFLTSSRPR